MKAQFTAAKFVTAAVLGVLAVALVGVALSSGRGEGETASSLGQSSGSPTESSTSTAVPGQPFRVRSEPARRVEPGSVPEAYRADYLPPGFALEDQWRYATDSTERHTVEYRHTDRLAKIWVTTYAKGVPSSMLSEIILGERDTFRGRPAYSSFAAITWVDRDDVIVLVMGRGRGVPTEEIRRVAEGVRRG